MELATTSSVVKELVDPITESRSVPNTFLGEAKCRPEAGEAAVSNEGMVLLGSSWDGGLKGESGVASSGLVGGAAARGEVVREEVMLRGRSRQPELCCCCCCCWDGCCCCGCCC